MLVKGGRDGADKYSGGNRVRGRHNRFFREHYGCDRLLLVARTLSFQHPVLKVPMRIQAPLGSHVLQLFAALGWPASESDY